MSVGVIVVRAGADGVVERHDDRDLEAALGQRPRQRAGDVGQAAGLGEADDFGGGEQDAGRVGGHRKNLPAKDTKGHREDKTPRIVLWPSHFVFSVSFVSLVVHFLFHFGGGTGIGLVTGAPPSSRTLRTIRSTSRSTAARSLPGKRRAATVAPPAGCRMT